MSKKSLNIIFIGLFAVLQMFVIFLMHSSTNPIKAIAQESEENMEYKIDKTEQEWKSELTEEEYRILREKGTERAFTGEYDLHFESGDYKCAGCGQVLFTSDTKYNSGCGWPAFYDVVDSSKVKFIEDFSYGMNRTEVVCSSCGGHLGHVFEDGPRDKTGLRYCINSVSLDFQEADTTKKD